VKLSEYLNNEKKRICSFQEGSGFRHGNRRIHRGGERYSLANKEAFKTNFWLRLLRDSEYIGKKLAASLITDCEELQKLLISSLKTARRKE
jgi:four helix bundle protein